MLRKWITSSMAMSDAPGTLPGIMGIFAHPDDESFQFAGTLARATTQGHPAAIVCATRGEVGEIADPSLATPENLGQVREGELREACAAVGVQDVSFLDYIDAQLAQADETEAVGRIVYHLRRFRPAVVATFAANGGYGHPDHMAIHRYTLAAIEVAADPTRYPEQITAGLAPHRVRKVYYTAFPRERMLAMREEALKQGQDFVPGGDAGTIPLEEMGTPMAEITTVVTLDDAEFAAKQQSMRAHATQMPSDGPFAQATPEQMREFMGRETLVLVSPPISDRAYPTPEEDIFAGL
jgi:LmbE family N-acetylglucosaminyl deacetylase